MRKNLVAVLLLGFLVGCGSGYGAARQRYAREYRCSASGVDVESLGGYSYRASGCGREAVYFCRKPEPTMGLRARAE